MTRTLFKKERLVVVEEYLLLSKITAAMLKLKNKNTRFSKGARKATKPSKCFYSHLSKEATTSDFSSDSVLLAIQPWVNTI